MVTAEDTKTEIEKMDSDDSAQQGGSKTEQLEKDRSEDIKKIENLFGEGYKLFIGSDFDGAAEKLAEATELSVDIYGQFATQGFKLHYYYGRSLVEIARTESILVKPPGAEQDAVSSDEDNETDLITKQNENAQKATDSVVGGQAPEIVVKTINESKADDVGCNSKEKNVDETLNTENNDNDEDEARSEDSTADVYLAWESLEVARKICDNQGDSSEWLQKKADVLVALGDCMTVGENFGKALEELNSALAIQKKVLEPHSRRLAETHFHIGITSKNNDDFDQAADSFESAAEVLKTAIEHIEGKLDTENPEASAIEELLELKKILVEVQEEVKDARDSGEVRKKQMEEQKAVVAQIFSKVLTEGFTNDEAPNVNDITELVRRGVKRPAPKGDEAPQ